MTKIDYCNDFEAALAFWLFAHGMRNEKSPARGDDREGVNISIYLIDRYSRYY